MLKILSAEQTRYADDYTIRHEPVASIDLMERASKAFVDEFTVYFGPDVPVYVFCGRGNNGGDGLAIARLLSEIEYEVKVWGIPSDSGSQDFLKNLDRLDSALYQEIVNEVPEIPANVVVIDALFGSGLSRPIEGVYAEIITAINYSDAEVVSVDIPSGVYADLAVDGEHVVMADLTISFQFPKLSFLLPENDSYIGDWTVVDIGLHQEVISETDTEAVLTDETDIVEAYLPRDRYSHKGSFGKTLILAGSYGKMGAAVLASRACLRSGVGLLTTYIPSCGYEILQTAVPEAMVEADAERDFLAYPPELDSYDSLAIGPGLGMHKLTVQLLGEILRNYDKPMVIDADALNIIGEHREMLGLIPQGSVLTPHVRELERLTAPARNDFHRLELLQKLSTDHKLNVILKGAYSVISDQEGRLFFNPTGNPGMATAGSGDVLSGIIAGLLARYDSFEAARMGVYLHGMAGDMASLEMGEDSLVAGDIIDFLPQAFQMFS